MKVIIIKANIKHRHLCVIGLFFLENIYQRKNVTTMIYRGIAMTEKVKNTLYSICVFRNKNVRALISFPKLNSILSRGN